MERKIQLEDLKEFFETLEHHWDGYYDDAVHLEGKVKAQSFDELESYPDKPIAFWFKGEVEDYYKLFYVTKNKFESYHTETQVLDSGSDLYRGEDYTRQWLEFQKLKEISETIETTC